MSNPERDWESLVQHVLACKTKAPEVAEDKIPLFWPHMWQSKRDVLQQWKDETIARKQCASKRENPQKQQLQLKRRRTMTFADFVDIAHQHGITNENEFWQIAGRERQAGNHALWNYGGKVIINEKIAKMLQMKRK